VIGYGLLMHFCDSNHEINVHKCNKRKKYNIKEQELLHADENTKTPKLQV